MRLPDFLSTSGTILLTVPQRRSHRTDEAMPIAHRNVTQIQVRCKSKLWKKIGDICYPSHRDKMISRRFTGIRRQAIFASPIAKPGHFSGNALQPALRTNGRIRRHIYRACVKIRISERFRDPIRQGTAENQLPSCNPCRPVQTGDSAENQLPAGGFFPQAARCQPSSGHNDNLPGEKPKRRTVFRVILPAHFADDSPLPASGSFFCVPLGSGGSGI